MYSDTDEIVFSLFEESARELIEYHSQSPVEISNAKCQLEGREVASVLGFGAERCDMHGSVALIGRPESIRTFNRDSVDNPSDWIGELNNQLVGRIKNRLIQYGVTVQMGTPIILSGDNLDLDGLSASQKHWRLTANGVSIYALLAFKAMPTCSLQLDSQKVVMEEGAVCLF